jgi:hypothetical protein
VKEISCSANALDSVENQCGHWKGTGNLAAKEGRRRRRGLMLQYYYVRYSQGP